MSPRYAPINFFDAVDGQNVTRGWTGKFIGSMTGTTGNGQGIYMGFRDEICSLLRISQHLVMGQRALGTHAIFFTCLSSLQRTQTTKLTFHRDATGMGHFNGAFSDINIIFIAGWRLAIFHQRAIHHHRGKTKLNGTLAYSWTGTMILMDTDWNMRPFFDGSLY